MPITAPTKKTAAKKDAPLQGHRGLPAQGRARDRAAMSKRATAAPVARVPKLTLSAKEDALSESVALPEADDWQLLIRDKRKSQAVVNKLNHALVETLEYAKSGEAGTWGDIRSAIESRIDAIADEYPDAGIHDSEGSLTIARFFGVNLEPAIYDFIRYKR